MDAHYTRQNAVLRTRDFKDDLVQPYLNIFIRKRKLFLNDYTTYV